MKTEEFEKTGQYTALVCCADKLTPEQFAAWSACTARAARAAKKAAASDETAWAYEAAAASWTEMAAKAANTTRFTSTVKKIEAAASFQRAWKDFVADVEAV